MRFDPFGYWALQDEIKAGKATIMATLDGITQTLQAQGTKLDQLTAEVKALASGGTVPPALQAQIETLNTAVIANDAKIAEALSAANPPTP